MDWKVLYVESRNEKKVVNLLEKLEVKVNCSVVTEVKQWSDCKKKGEGTFIKFINFCGDSRK